MVRIFEPGDEGNNSVTDRKEEPTGGADGDSQPTGIIERRSFMKLTGAAAMGAVGIGSLGTASAQQDYEVWEITSPEVYDLSDGEELSNVLIDQTHSEGSLTIRSMNKDDWVVRNVGFLGVGNTDGDGSYQFQVSTSSDGTGLIENVWMNGKADPRGTELGGILVRSGHAGHLDIRHTYIEGFGNNAVYGSNCHPDDGGNSGTVTVENAFHRDNTVGQFRLGTTGSAIRNSVGIVHNPESDDELRGNYYTSEDEFNARGMWARWDGEVTIENSSLYISSEDIQPDAAFNTSKGATLNVVDCDVNSDAPQIVDECDSCDVSTSGLGEEPTVDVIGDGGVPTSAEMAASGGRELPTPSELPAPSGDDSTSDDGSTLDRTLTVDGTDADWTDYEFTVSEAIENNPDVGTFDDDDVIDGSTASGFVNGGVDGYLFSGEITDATVDGDATVLVDGEQVEFSPDISNTIEVTKDGAPDGKAEFTVTVSEALEPMDNFEADGSDSIDGTTATGKIGPNGGTDGLRYAGEITAFSLDGPAVVYRNGEEVDPATLGDT